MTSSSIHVERRFRLREFLVLISQILNPLWNLPSELSRIQEGDTLRGANYFLFLFTGGQRSIKKEIQTE